MQGRASAARSTLGWRAYLVLALISLAFYLPGQSRLPPVDRDESRYAQATSQMLQTHNFVDVRYQDQPRYLQPVGIYWLQSLSVSLLSTPTAKQIWAYRVPSLISATGAVLLTAWIGAMLFGAEAGFAAALLLAMSMLLNFEARMAKIDATLLAATLTAQGALLRAYLAGISAERKGRGRWNAALFWLALGVGLLLKGPIILIVSGTTIAAVCAQDRKVAWLKRLHAGWGVVLMLAVALPWFVAIGIKTHGAFFAKAVGQNLMGKLGRGEQAHGSFIGYYLALFPVTFWPGSLVAGFAVPWTWRNRITPQVRFLLAWIIPTWLIYEMIATKLPHYALPYYPAVACLAAGAALGADGWKVGRLGKALASVWALIWLAVGATFACGGAYLIWRFEHRLDPVALTAAVVAILLSLLALWFVYRKDLRFAVLAGGGASLITFAGLYAHSLPATPTLWFSPRITAAAAHAAQCPTTVLASSGFSEPSLVFLNGRSTLLVNVKKTADHLARDPGCGLSLVAKRQLPAFMKELAAIHMSATPVGAISGVNYSWGRWLDLTLFKAGPRTGPPVPIPPDPPKPGETNNPYVQP